MSRPITQTFYVSEPNIEGVFLTQLGVYFANVSQVEGITCEIRTVENGSPTNKMLPFGFSYLFPGDLVPGANTTNATANNWALKVSKNASLETKFIFETPVFLESNKQYAFSLIPDAASPDYQIYTSVTGLKDLTTGINSSTLNSETGDLFLSTNDLTFSPVIGEDMKFNIYIAEFTANTGTAYFNSRDNEYILLKDRTGGFIEKEDFVFGNGYFDYRVFTISSATGSFYNGDLLYQSNGSANIGYGIIYSSNATTIKIRDANGTFSNTYEISSANSGSNATVTAISQNVVVTLNSNLISVPDASIFTSNSKIYIQTNNRDYSQTFRITNTHSSNNNIQTQFVARFEDTNALYGGLLANGELLAKFSNLSPYKDNYFIGAFTDSTANIASNLAGVQGVQMIGLISGQSANMATICDMHYNSATLDYNDLAIQDTEISYSIKGFKLANNYPADTEFVDIDPVEVNEIIDATRVLPSRSNELASLPVGRKGNNSIVVKSVLARSNPEGDQNKISPVIDKSSRNIILTKNLSVNQKIANVVTLYISNTDITANNGFLPGDKLIQNTSSQTGYSNSTAWGYVEYSNNSSVVVSSVNGLFVSNIAFTSKTANSSYSSNGFSGLVVSALTSSESDPAGGIATSKYISKNVLLSQGQDAEDVLVYTTAHRPANTNLLVYASIKNTQDNESIDFKSWTKLKEISPTNLFSSAEELEDNVELVHGFYKSLNIFANGTRVNTTSNTIICQSTENISNNSFVYTGISNATISSFNVRKVVHVLNTTAFTVDKTPTFYSNTATLGVIPGIENRTSAFLYDQNNNIVRYCTDSDAVYDSYIQFALKVVFTSENNGEVVPFMNDIRAIALQV